MGVQRDMDLEFGGRSQACIALHHMWRGTQICMPVCKPSQSRATLTYHQSECRVAIHGLLASMEIPCGGFMKFGVPFRGSLQ